MRNVPMFDKPPIQPVALSRSLGGHENRLVRGEKAKWTQVKLKTYRPCEECSCVQHESNGEFGPRRQAKHRRRTPLGLVLELCTAHANLWRRRDESDAGVS